MKNLARIPIRLLLLTGLAVLSLIACQSTNNSSAVNKEIVLDARYLAFENLISKANCSGPGFEYTTEVHSTKDGYTLFKQVRKGEMEAYLAVIPNSKEGFVMNDAGAITDTLSRESVEVVRSHEFHKVHMQPEKYFNNLAYEADTLYLSKPCEWYSGIDILGNKVRLYYDRPNQLIIGLQMLNPHNKAESIEVNYKAWMDSEWGKMVKALEIIQGGKDVYLFDFIDIELNSTNFERII